MSTMETNSSTAVAGQHSEMPDPWRQNFDLHCHSRRSDGTLSPTELVERAHRNGVTVLALTDHDELSGQAEAAAAAKSLGLGYVPGVEVSVTWAGETIHIVGLRVNPNDKTLLDGLQRTRDGRDLRAQEMGEGLAKVGIPGAYEGALKFVGNPKLISRTHFARFLVESGVCSDVREVFTKYLVEGKPGFVGHRWAKLSEAVSWIIAAGGTAVLAHPGRYRLNDTARWALYEEFKQAGGQAIEVVCGSHSKEQYREFAKLALKLGLRASRGSDFHSPDESHTDLGQLPPLPDSVVPVWYDWPEAERFSG
jgi:3',5'-nucleoside bisphosphate phosphatase